MSRQATDAIRMLIFTGARLREILDLKWENVDLERGLLLLPDSKTGRKTIVLNEAAIDILKAHPKLGSYVIAGDNPDRPRTDLKKPWAAICKHAALEGVRLHDLRHTFASIGAGASLGLPIVGGLAGPLAASDNGKVRPFGCRPSSSGDQHHRPSFGEFDGGANELGQVGMAGVWPWF